MLTANDLPDVLETTHAERLATGFTFTEGPLWHPDGYWYFVDLRRNMLFRLTPGKEPELVRTTIGGNGTTFDLQGRLIVCEGDDRRLTRMAADGKVESLVDTYKGGRFNRPNDVICHSNGCLYFTDPDKRRPYHEREIPGPAGANNLWDGACVYRLAPDGSLSVLAHCEYPNGLALSPDEHTMYVANTRSSQYIHAIRLDAAGNMVERSIWVMAPDGKRSRHHQMARAGGQFCLRRAEPAVLCCAYTSVYTLRVKVPGNPNPWYRLRGTGDCRLPDP